MLPIAASRFRRRLQLLGPPSFIGVSAVVTGAGPTNYPGSYAAGDLVVLISSTAGGIATPSGFTSQSNQTWYTSGSFNLQVFTKVIAADTNVTVTGSQAHVLLVYRNATTVGTIGTISESIDAAASHTLTAINPSITRNTVLAIIIDRDPVGPSLTTGGWTARVSGNALLFGIAVADRSTGSTGTTGTVAFNQDVGNPFRAAGYLIEIK